MASSILVTGAAGHLGRRVVELLLERGAGQIVATTRKPEALADLAAKGVKVRRADFEDEATLPEAFAGVTRALLVSTDAVERPGQRLAQHRAAVRALAKVGVGHVVYTSLPNPIASPVTIASDHAGTEEALVASGLAYTVLRNNLYTDLLLQSLPGAVASGQIIDAKGAGPVAWVTREDCAHAAAGALLSGGNGRRVLDVSGPAAVSSAELAEILSKIVDRPIAHVNVPGDALVSGMVEHGLPEPVAKLLASFDRAAELGLLANVTDTVERLGKKRPTSVADFLVANRQALLAAAG